MDETLLSTEQVSEMIGLKLQTIQKLARQGRIPAYHVTNEWRYKRSEIEAWLKARRRCMVVMSPQTTADVKEHDIPQRAKLFRPGEVLQDTPLTVGVLLASREDAEKFLLRFRGLLIAGVQTGGE